MSMQWFRVYTDILDDAKVVSLAFEDQRHFIAILALKCLGTLDQGCAPDLLDRIVAQRLWVDQSAIREVKRRLVEAGLIGEDWQPVAWSRRQFVSDHDPTGKERQQRYRDRKKQETEAKDSNALRNAPSNASVTLPDTDTDTDTDTDVMRVREGVIGGEKPKPPADARGARLALHDLPAEYSSWCQAHHPDLDAQATWEVFRDYWTAQPGTRGLKTNWLATWRNWCRREKQQPPNGGHNGQPYESAYDRRARINRVFIDAGQRAFDEMGNGPVGAVRAHLAEGVG